MVVLDCECTDSVFRRYLGLLLVTEKKLRRNKKRVPWRTSKPPRFMEPFVTDELRQSQIFNLYREKKEILRSEAQSTYLAKNEFYLEIGANYPFRGECYLQVFGEHSFSSGGQYGDKEAYRETEKIVNIENRKIFEQIAPELENIGVWNWRMKEEGYHGLDGWGSSIQLGTVDGVMESSQWSTWPVDLGPTTYKTLLSFVQLVGPVFGQPEFSEAFKVWGEHVNGASKK